MSFFASQRLFNGRSSTGPRNLVNRSTGPNESPSAAPTATGTAGDAATIGATNTTGPCASA